VNGKRMTRDLTSARLSLTPLASLDVPALHRLWVDERVRRFLWDGEIVSLEKTEEIIETNSRLFRDHGFGIWAVRERTSDDLIGFAGYWNFRRPPSLELLFGVAPAYWGRGIATESSRCVIRYGFEVLDFQVIEASTDVANAASLRVLEKLGMVLCRRVVVDGLDTVYYSLARPNWQRTVLASVARCL
jgi:[ribosomal protein S5]-alanine N-acetyltransferase